jgi:flagellar hook protein FlgE
LTATHPTKFEVFDCQGISHTLEVVYKKIGENNWRWEAFFPKEPNLIAEPNNGFMQFGPCGKLISPDSVELNIPYSVTGAKDAKITLDFSGRSFGHTDAIEGVTQYGSPTTAKAEFVDGYAMGIMTDFSVARDGTINGNYSNGKIIPLYKLALATFANPNGLERIGNTCFRESANSGLAQIGVPMQGGAGEVIGSNLEMSNVDISEEFTRLILAQRGFQANARIVTVSDGMLEELVNLKR